MIFTQLTQQLLLLNNLLSKLTDEQYNFKTTHLSNASIGGHTRHIIELLQCAITGYSAGEIDYVNRNRNLVLETNKNAAQIALINISATIKLADKQLKLIVDEIEETIALPITTTYFREIVYNAEHTIHHLALIKVALIEMKLNVVDTHFGMAYSTIKYKENLSYETN